MFAFDARTVAWLHADLVMVFLGLVVATWLTARLTAIDHLLGDGRQLTGELARGLASYGVVEPLP